MSTGIEWTDETWNPVVGCKAVSPGCDHCYAAREASGRLSGVPVYAGLAEGGVFTGEVRCLPERLEQPLRWKKPRRIFVNSMSDLFHPDVPIEYIESVFDVMGRARRHDFQILTKRPQRMAMVLHELGAAKAIWSNVWVGTSIESDRYTFRADWLRKTPATTRFLSIEPLLGPLPSLDLSEIDWVIVGGESGPKARPMHPDWARQVRDACQLLEIPFLFKQWGEWRPREKDEAAQMVVARDGMTTWTADASNIALFERQGAVMVRPGKKAAGRELDGQTWDQYPG